jgi:hypothetical protein
MRARLGKGKVVHVVGSFTTTRGLPLIRMLCADAKSHWHREATVTYTTDPVTCKKCLRKMGK